MAVLLALQAVLVDVAVDPLDDQDAAAVMRACNVDVEKLRRNLASYVESELEKLVTNVSEDSKPTAGFQRVIQRAVIHVQSSGREEVTGANVLWRSLPNGRATPPISYRSRR